MNMAKTLVTLATVCGLCLLVGNDADAQSASGVVTGNAESGSGPYNEAISNHISGTEPKIVGGKQAPAGSFPWQVSLGVSWFADPYREHFCGGTAYSATWIITAAHCVQNMEPTKIVVTAGTHQLGDGGIRRNVKQIGRAHV